jgi:methionyl-tRNA formyltransferase
VRIAYFGTGSFAIPALLRMSENVVLVVTQPDRPTGRNLRLQPTPIKLAAHSLGLPVETPEKSRSPEFVEQIKGLEVDFLLVASYGQLLSEAMLGSARRGGINLHGSILPAWRGAAPIQRSILAGDAETGVTLMQMDRGMDTGDTIAIARTPIGLDETYGSVQERLAVYAADLIEAWAVRIADGDYTRTPQDSAAATTAPKIDRQETRLSLEADAQSEYNRFRAFTPTPGAYLETKFGRLKLIDVALNDAPGTSGTVVALNPAPTIAFGAGSLTLTGVQPEGRQRMEGKAWANGARLRIGDNLQAK